MDGDDEQKVEWNAEYIRDLPDSAFLYVEAGDVKDDEGKTIPRSKRHFPYKDAAGTIDRGHLQEALEQIPRSAGTEVDADVLVARVRRMLETSPDGVKAIVESSEWIDGAPLRIRAVAYKLLDASEKIAAEQAAMRLLGQDVKAGDRVQSTRRNELRDAERALHKVIEWTDMVEAGADSKARMDYYNRALQMMEV